MAILARSRSNKAGIVGMQGITGGRKGKQVDDHVFVLSHKRVLRVRRPKRLVSVSRVTQNSTLNRSCSPAGLEMLLPWNQFPDRRKNAQDYRQVPFVIKNSNIEFSASAYSMLNRMSLPVPLRYA